MKYCTSKKFDKIIFKIKDKEVLKKLKIMIVKISQAKFLDEILNIKPMTGFPGYYRLRAGEYRLGLELEGDTVWLLYFGKRDENTYRNFP